MPGICPHQRLFGGQWQTVPSNCSWLLTMLAADAAPAESVALPYLLLARSLPSPRQFVMFFAQAALVNWRKRHRRSYDLATLIGLWLIPPIISVQLGGQHRWPGVSH